MAPLRPLPYMTPPALSPRNYHSARSELTAPRPELPLHTLAASEHWVRTHDLPVNKATPWIFFIRKGADKGGAADKE